MFKCKLNKQEFQQHLFLLFSILMINKIRYDMKCDVFVYFSDCDAKSDKSISNNNTNAINLISKPTGRSSR
jgi:hypothetical protein